MIRPRGHAAVKFGRSGTPGMVDEQDGNTTRKAKVVVRFDQQQRKLLDFLRAEKTFGTEDGEIIRNVVLDWLKGQAKK